MTAGDESPRIGKGALTAHAPDPHSARRKSGAGLQVGQIRQIAEDISEFRDVPIADLPTVAEHLRHVPPPRMGWGHWRAVPHDFVYEMLTKIRLPLC